MRRSCFALWLKCAQEAAMRNELQPTKAYYSPNRRAATLALASVCWPTATRAQRAAPVSPWHADRLPALEAQLRANPNVRAFLMERRGATFAHYRADTTPNTRANVASVTKTVMSLLVGIAIERGLIASVNEPLADFFTEYARGPYAATMQRVTLRHLLTLTPGFESSGLDANSDFMAFTQRLYQPGILEHALGRRVVDAPGTKFYYSNLDVHLVAMALSRRLKAPMADFARETLFQPLGMETVEWPQGPDGIPNGASELRLSAQELMRLGRMMLDGGMWQGRQLVPRQYILEATTRQVASDAPVRGPAVLWGYGYLIWTASTPGDNLAAYYAAGYGGQFIYVVPALDLVVVATTDQVSREVAGRTAAIIRDFALPAVPR